MKSAKYGAFSGPHFPVFGLNTDIYFVNLRIQSKYRKIRTRKNSVFGHFSLRASDIFALLPLLSDSINSTAMVCHCITVICEITEHVNPGKSPVITGDRPVYVLGK